MDVGMGGGTGGGGGGGPATFSAFNIVPIGVTWKESTSNGPRPPPPIVATWLRSWTSASRCYLVSLVSKSLWYKRSIIDTTGTDASLASLNSQKHHMPFKGTVNQSGAPPPVRNTTGLLPGLLLTYQRHHRLVRGTIGCQWDHRQMQEPVRATTDLPGTQLTVPGTTALSGSLPACGGAPKDWKGYHQSIRGTTDLSGTPPTCQGYLQLTSMGTIYLSGTPPTCQGHHTSNRVAIDLSGTSST